MMINKKSNEDLSPDVEVIFNHLHFISSFIMILLVPVFSYIIFELKGFLISLIFVFITLPFTLIGIKLWKQINLKQFYKSCSIVVNLKVTLIFLLAALNIILILKIVLNTLLPISIIGLIFIVGIGIGLFVWKYQKWKHQFLVSFIIIPSIINLFFTINYVFSSDAVVEQYRYEPEQQMVDGLNQTTPLIILENNKYEKYVGIRFFGNHQELEDKHYITYTFKKGFLGFKVMTNYEFNYNR